MTRDERDIGEVVRLLAELADRGDVEAYLTLFTPDAVWSMPESGAVGLPAGERRGLAEIEAGVRERQAAGIVGPGTNTRHVVSLESIERRGGDTAVAHSTWEFVLDSDAGTTVTRAGRYRDTFRHVDAGWRLAHREITTT